jgi:hypothetical protein
VSVPLAASVIDPTLPPEAEDVRCPLCDYDLRGLVDPRCPECGYAFDWAELTDPARRQHRYLFEHHPERNVWSFFRTMIGHLRPRRFWGELHPSQPSRPRRLIGYALVIVLSAFPPMVLPALAAVHYSWKQMETRRQQWTVRLQSTPPQAAWWVRGRPTTMSTQQALDVFAPAPTWRGAIRQAYLHGVLSGELRAYGLALLWPVLTLTAFMIFAVSMRRARVRRVHLVRCVVYAADALVWANLLLTFFIGFELARYLLGVSWGGNYRSVMAETFVAAVVVFAYRLCVAFKKYLRFDHPVSTVLSTQVIVLLVTAIMVILMYA